MNPLAFWQEFSVWFAALPWPVRAFWIGLAAFVLVCIVAVVTCAWQDAYATRGVDRTLPNRKLPNRQPDCFQDAARPDRNARVRRFQSKGRVS